MQTPRDNVRGHPDDTAALTDQRVLRVRPVPAHGRCESTILGGIAIVEQEELQSQRAIARRRQAFEQFRIQGPGRCLPGALRAFVGLDDVHKDGPGRSGARDEGQDRDGGGNDGTRDLVLRSMGTIAGLSMGPRDHDSIRVPPYSPSEC